MNEFTKEELEEIRHGICHLISVGSCDSQWNKDIKTLKEKIQSMIDNYCEHESIGQVSDVDYVNICIECKELTGWV